MTTGWRGSRGWTARFAALLFLVQAALLGFALGATAAPMPRDAFGNVLCTAGAMDRRGAAERSSGHPAGLLECCSFGCAMVGGPIAPPPEFAALAAPRPLVLSVPFLVYDDIGSGAVETPRRTRGPPATA